MVARDPPNMAHILAKLEKNLHFFEEYYLLRYNAV
jgi:hypothetical protein